MKDAHYTLTGRVVSKKNSRINTRSGRSFPSKKYTEWHTDASYQLKNAPVRRFNEGDVESIHIVFYSPDRRAFDLSNKFESIADLLVDNGILQDDNYKVVPRVYLEYGGVEKGGLTEITIYAS